MMPGFLMMAPMSPTHPLHRGVSPPRVGQPALILEVYMMSTFQDLRAKGWVIVAIPPADTSKLTERERATLERHMTLAAYNKLDEINELHQTA